MHLQSPYALRSLIREKRTRSIDVHRLRFIIFNFVRIDGVWGFNSVWLINIVRDAIKMQS
jgi:4-alpha-glucanotransferase